MKSTSQRSKAQRRPVTEKKRKASRGRPAGVVVTSVTPPAPRARVRLLAREIMGIRCRVVGVHPEAEAIVLSDFYGKQMIVPVTSAARDGHLVRDLARLVGRDVWLSMRLS